MDKELAKKLIPLINSPEFKNFIQYLQQRIDYYHERLEFDLDAKHQGAILELKQLQQLRTKVLATLGYTFDEKGNPKNN
jgi:hypothetical protein